MLVRRARADAIRSRLLAWWDAGHRDLPWRFPQHAADPYRVWIAEVMLQQTQVAVVVPYYRRFLRRFPTLEALARANDDEVLAAWSGLGYYARARRLGAAAREALARHGRLPGTFEALSGLPGFGRYTAGAVASIAFAQRVPCVDGNVARVLARLFLLEGDPQNRHAVETLWQLADALVPRERPGDLNQALMELGATVCVKATPRCGTCPVTALCRARRAGRADVVPAARRRASPTKLELACAVVRGRGGVLLVQRPPGGLFAGLWELPGVELVEGVDPREALRSALEARLGGVAVVVGEEVASVTRRLTHRVLRMTAYECATARIVPEVGRWMKAPPRRGKLPATGMGTATRLLLEALPGQEPLTRRGVTV